MKNEIEYSVRITSINKNWDIRFSIDNNMWKVISPWLKMKSFEPLNFKTIKNFVENYEWDDIHILGELNKLADNEKRFDEYFLDGLELDLDDWSETFEIWQESRYKLHNYYDKDQNLVSWIFDSNEWKFFKIDSIWSIWEIIYEDWKEAIFSNFFYESYWHWDLHEDKRSKLTKLNLFTLKVIEEFSYLWTVDSWYADVKYFLVKDVNWTLKLVDDKMNLVVELLDYVEDSQFGWNWISIDWNYSFNESLIIWLDKNNNIKFSLLNKKTLKITEIFKWMLDKTVWKEWIKIEERKDSRDIVSFKISQKICNEVKYSFLMKRRINWDEVKIEIWNWWFREIKHFEIDWSYKWYIAIIDNNWSSYYWNNEKRKIDIYDEFFQFIKSIEIEDEKLKWTSLSIFSSLIINKEKIILSNYLSDFTWKNETTEIEHWIVWK